LHRNDVGVGLKGTTVTVVSSFHYGAVVIEFDIHTQIGTAIIIGNSRPIPTINGIFSVRKADANRSFPIGIGLVIYRGSLDLKGFAFGGKYLSPGLGYYPDITGYPKRIIGKTTIYIDNNLRRRFCTPAASGGSTGGANEK
jgi:hypothetical protein